MRFCGCMPRLAIVVTLFSYSLDLWILSALPRVVSGFVSPGLLLPRQRSGNTYDNHARDGHAWIVHPIHAGTGISAVVRTAGHSEPKPLLGLACSTTDVMGGCVASTCGHDGVPLSGREAVECAASRLAPLFFEVDAHTQR